MADDGSVKIKIDAEDDGATKKLEQVGDAVEEVGESSEDAAKDVDKAIEKVEELGDKSDKAGEEVKGLGDESDKAKEKVKGFGDESEKTSESLSAFEVTIGNLVADGITSLVSGIGDAISNIVALADETREYREDIAKLETAFTTAGHSTETAASVYENFYKLLGESDQSVEASNHLAEMVKNEEDVAKWSSIAAGTLATFQDSLPLESLTESAKQTAELGKLTGPLVDAIERAGIGEEEFNKQLAECNTEQERAALITETLYKNYSEAGEAYNELTKSTQDARLATANMEEAQAGLGAAIEPVTTAWTNLKANALEAILPVVQTVSQKLLDLQKWAEENPSKWAVVKAVIVGVAVALGVLAAALGIGVLIQTVTAAFATLNLTMLANPIVWIVAAIAGLVAAFILLWNNCEGFRNFWIALWENIKVILEPVIEWIKEAFAIAWAAIQEAWGKAQPYFAQIWEGIKAVFSVVAEILGAFFRDAWAAIQVYWNVAKAYFAAVWAGIQAVFSVAKAVLSGFFQTAWVAIQAVWNTAKAYFSAVWSTIKGIFAVVKAVLSGNWQEAWDAIKGIVNTWKEYFAIVWQNIKNVFASVGSWFKNVFTVAADGVKNVWNKVKSYFQTVFDGIKEIFSTSSLKDIGKNIVEGLWNGISDMASWIGNKIKSFGEGVLGGIKDFFGINSPSKLIEDEVGVYVGQAVVPNRQPALNKVKNQIGKFSDFVADNVKLSTIQATVGAEQSRMGASVGTANNGYMDMVQALGLQTAGINSLAHSFSRKSSIAQPVILELDGRELGRTVVDVSNSEGVRTGVRLATVGG